MQGNYRTEFPGFDLAGITIPDGWTDVSWRNNGAPSWRAIVSDHLSVDIWIDHADPAARECEQERFVVAAVMPDGAHLCHLIATDEWSDVLGAVAYARTLPDLTALLSDDRHALAALARAVDMPGAWNDMWLADKVAAYADPASVVAECIEDNCRAYLAEVDQLRADMILACHCGANGLHALSLRYQPVPCPDEMEEHESRPIVVASILERARDMNVPRDLLKASA